MADDYRFGMMDHSPGEIAAVSELVRSVFPHARYLTARYLQWQYVDSPDGRAVGCNGFANGRMVAHIAGVPLRARLDGDEQRGLFLVNGAVRPDHRGRSVARIAAKTIREEATRLGYAFMLGTGNRYSTEPLRAHYETVKPLDARLGLGRPRRRRESLAPVFERLWSREAMAWRLGNPERSYSVRARNGRVIVTAPAGKAGIGAILYDGNDQWGLADRGRPHGPLRVWLGADPALDWARSSYVSIPDRLRASPLNLFFRDLSGNGLHLDPERILFRAIDFDPY